MRVMLIDNDSTVQGMLIRVRVTSNAKEARLTKTSETSYEVKVDQKAIGGRANKRLLEILSKHFNVPKSRVTLASGAKSRDKIVEIILENPSNPSSRAS